MKLAKTIAYILSSLLCVLSIIQSSSYSVICTSLLVLVGLTDYLSNKGKLNVSNKNFILGMLTATTLLTIGKINLYVMLISGILFVITEIPKVKAVK